MADSTCVTLGHFYEDYECLYCGVRYCATEFGGHSFEAEGYPVYQKRGFMLFCYHCHQQRVNILKG